MTPLPEGRNRIRPGFSGGGVRCLDLVVVRPEAEDFDGAFFQQDLVHEAVLDIDASGIGAGKVADQFFVGRGDLKRVFLEDFKQRFRFRAKSGRRQFLGIFSGLFREDELPAHQPGFLEQRLGGVLSPLRMDSRIPGMETRYNVSWIARQSSSETRTPLACFPVIWTGECEEATFSRCLYRLALARVAVSVVIVQVSLLKAYQITYVFSRGIS